MTATAGVAGRRLRRARGEGSIQLWHGRWRVRIRWKGKEGTWFATSKSEAVALLRQKLRERDEPQPSGKGSVNLWLDEWLAQIAMARPRTHPFYRQKLAHLRPLIGDRKLSALEARDVRVALASLSHSGMSASMLNHVYRSLSAALNAAVKERRLVHNPCRDITAPKRGQFEALTLTVEQSQRLVQAAWDTRLGPLIVVALSTGMRAGELMALTWDDVDHGLLTVNKSVQWKAQGKHQAGPTKTRSGRRTVRVSGPALEALTAQRQRCARMELVATKWQARNLVFPAQSGGYLIPSGAFVREFRGLLERAECPRIRFHDLRHTAGLYLTRSVGVVVASRILGHADPAITARYYGHAQLDDYNAAARAMGELLQPPSISPEAAL